MRCSWLAVAALSVAACGGQVDHAGEAEVEAALAEDTAETARTGSQGSAMSRVFMLGLTDLDTDGALAAKRVVLGAKAQLGGYLPLGCATVTSPAPGHARVHFDGCRGPYGLVTLNGDLEATFQSREPGQKWRMHVEIPAGSTLTANGRQLSHTADAEVAIVDGERQVTWHVASTGLTQKGEIVAHSADVDLRFDPSARCVDVAGVTRGSVGDRGIESTIDGYTVCADGCPTSGTITSVGKSSKRAVTLRFDGTGVAHATGRKGRTFDVPLACTD